MIKLLVKIKKDVGQSELPGTAKSPPTMKPTPERERFCRCGYIEFCGFGIPGFKRL